MILKSCLEKCKIPFHDAGLTQVCNSVSLALNNLSPLQLHTGLYNCSNYCKLLKLCAQFLHILISRFDLIMCLVLMPLIGNLI